jgi:pimeloyl-ACP methyl ester carboxylesterase
MPWPETPGERARAGAEIPRIFPSPEGDLVGIFTPPAPAARPTGICAVHLTRPRSHRNRNWVRGARWLAERGFAAFRFDYHGTGDSGGESSFLDPSAPYRSDLTAVLRALGETFGQRRFVLTGSCFDARTALSALIDGSEPILGVGFISAPVMPLEAMRELRNAKRSWGDMLQAVAKTDNWKRLGDPELWRAVETRLRGANRPDAAPEEAASPLDPAFLEAFRALEASRARALFLYGEEDQEFHTFEPVVRQLWPALSAESRSRIEIEIWPGAVHDGFQEVERQRRIIERMLEWISSFHPEAARESSSGAGSTSRGEPA